MPAGTPRRRAIVRRGTLPEIARLAHEVIRAGGPDLRTERRWGHPWYVGKDLVCVVGSFAHHVGVEFWRGASLPDRYGLLEGTGKNLRHVKLRSLAEARSPRFTALVRAAVRLDRVSEKRVR